MAFVSDLKRNFIDIIRQEKYDLSDILPGIRWRVRAILRAVNGHKEVNLKDTTSFGRDGFIQLEARVQAKLFELHISSAEDLINWNFIQLLANKRTFDEVTQEVNLEEFRTIVELRRQLKQIAELHNSSDYDIDQDAWYSDSNIDLNTCRRLVNAMIELGITPAKYGGLLRSYMPTLSSWAVGRSKCQLLTIREQIILKQYGFNSVGVVDRSHFIVRDSAETRIKQMISAHRLEQLRLSRERLIALFETE